jgi:O-methyltransferase
MNTSPKILNTRKEILDILPKNISIAEIGVFKGDFSKEIFKIVKPSKLYLVDIFSGSMGSGDKDGLNFEFISLDQSLKNLNEFFSGEENVHIIKSYSIDFLRLLEDEYLDAIYIDADHSYAAVKQDLELSYLKVKKGGFIMGHDYCNKNFPSVVSAVNEFCKKYNLEIKYITKDGCPSFLIEK